MDTHDFSLTMQAREAGYDWNEYDRLIAECQSEEAKTIIRKMKRTAYLREEASAGML